MDLNTLQSVLNIGETIGVEFKRCGNGIESDVYESVCSFLNRFGGDIYMGVLDDGTVIGVPEKAAPDMVKNFIKTVSNPMLFSLLCTLCRKLSSMMIHIQLSTYMYLLVPRFTALRRSYMTEWMMQM